MILASPDLGAQSPTHLPGSAALERQGDLAEQMQADVDRFLLRLTDRAAESRVRLSGAGGADDERRERFQQLIGVVDPRVPFDSWQRATSLDDPALVAETDELTIQAVRWPVLEGVTGEGLLLEPRQRVQCLIVALPDADWTPEVLAGLEKGAFPSADFARRLAASGCRVLVPTLINRRDTWSGNPQIRMLNQPHREFIYRPAFYLGRHIIGYEVQKVLAAVDHFVTQQQAGKRRLPIGVAGYGEGALIAFYSAAIDERIDAALVSGYFQQRSELWREPIYRNVWSLLREFGDAEIAGLIAPRGLVVEASRGVEIDGPPQPRPGGRNQAASGSLRSPPIASVRSEFARAAAVFDACGAASQCILRESQAGMGPPGSKDALREFLYLLGVEGSVASTPAKVLADQRKSFDAERRWKRQFQELAAFNQRKFWESGAKRAAFWRSVERDSPENWRDSVHAKRTYLLDHVIGDWPIDSAPPRPRTRLVYETQAWTGYEVVLDVTPEIWAYGILLVPKSIGPAERRPVVVAQHGRGGHPQDLCDPHRDHRAYHQFGADLAARGFVIFAPQNLYFGEEKYRLIQRKANPLGLSLFAPMVWQHQALLKWLASLSFVDPERIGFYGLSYGGKSALLIPAVLKGYCLSICSGAFTDTVRKHVDAVGGNRAVFLFTNEYEHLEFDFAEKFNHAELAWLISPRPFMVEKGHWDGGLPDEWTAYEYARVRRHYTRLQMGHLTEIEFFDGGHEINRQGTYAFLQRHLRR